MSKQEANKWLVECSRIFDTYYADKMQNKITTTEQTIDIMLSILMRQHWIMEYLLKKKEDLTQ